MTDYYRLLEVDPQASQEVIEKAFKALTLKCHPDTNRDADQAAVAAYWMEIRAAYEVLCDTKKRAAYDAMRKRDMFDLFLNEGLLGLAKRYLR